MEYKSEAERTFDGQRTNYFFADDRFKYAFIVDPNKEAYTLSLCTTCMIVRPPRSFHCSQCGVCIEQQDHHCPWMGTCVGKRNLKYFLSFLILTALHAFVTAAICSAYYLQVTIDIDVWDYDRAIERNMGMMSAGVGLYAGIIGMTLFFFWLYSMCLWSDNITSNENLRTRWNAKRNKYFNRNAKRLNSKPNE